MRRTSVLFISDFLSNKMFKPVHTYYKINRHTRRPLKMNIPSASMPFYKEGSGLYCLLAMMCCSTYSTNNWTPNPVPPLHI